MSEHLRKAFDLLTQNGTEMDAAPGDWAMLWAPAESVAMVKVPISIDGLVAVTKALEVAYGKGLVIRTDQRGIDGWILIARSEHTEGNK